MITVYVVRMTCRYQRTIKIKILDNFEKIESVLPQIHGDRKRMVNINFILKQMLKKIKLLYKNIPISKSKRIFIYHFIRNIGVEFKHQSVMISKNYSEMNFCEYSLSHLSTKGHISIMISTITLT